MTMYGIRSRTTVEMNGFLETHIVDEIIVPKITSFMDFGLIKGNCRLASSPEDTSYSKKILSILLSNYLFSADEIIELQTSLVVTAV